MPSVSTVGGMPRRRRSFADVSLAHRYRPPVIPAFAGLPSTIQGCAGSVPFLLELYHPHLQDNPTQEQDQLDVVVGADLWVNNLRCPLTAFPIS